MPEGTNRQGSSAHTLCPWVQDLRLSPALCCWCLSQLRRLLCLFLAFSPAFPGWGRAPATWGSLDGPWTWFIPGCARAINGPFSSPWLYLSSWAPAELCCGGWGHCPARVALSSQPLLPCSCCSLEKEVYFNIFQYKFLFSFHSKVSSAWDGRSYTVLRSYFYNIQLHYNAIMIYVLNNTKGWKTKQ